VSYENVSTRVTLYQNYVTYLRVSVWHMCAFLCRSKSVDDISQTAQTLVDVLCLLEARPFSLGVFKSL